MKQDRNLLFGVLAIQLGKLTASRFVAAGEAWAKNPSVPLHDVLVGRGDLSREDCHLLNSLVDAAVNEQGGDEFAALRSLGGPDLIRTSFAGRLEIDADGSVRTIPSDALPTGGTIDIPALEEAAGRYTQVSEYGRGGMGRVLLIHDQHLGRDIALKELLPTPDPDATTLKPGTPVRNLMPFVHRFLQEARLTGQLEHPSIVPVYEVGRRRDGRLYYTMKLVRGKTMGKILRESDTLEKRMTFLPQYLSLCHAMAYAHTHRVIHRDIKPDNVMIGDFGETVVIDWGLAKVIDRADIHADGIRETIRAMRVEPYLPASTQYGEALGTPVYMPPEQARGDLDQVDERSDVYSLGAVLYELLTGALPFEGDTVKDILAKVRSEQPKPVRGIVPDAPPELIAVCERAMNPDRAKRYGNAGELAAEIERYLSGALVQAYRYQPSEHLRRFFRKHRAMIVTVTMAIFALVILGAVSYVQVRRQRDAAIVARRDAVAARDQEQRQREQTERQLYISCLFRARESMEDRRYDLAADALEKAPEGLRQWEWYYYDRLCHLDERTLSARQRAIVSIEYSPDGKRVLTGSEDGAARIWDTGTGTLATTLSGHTSELVCAHYSVDGSKIVTASLDNTAKIWDGQTGALLLTLEGHSEPVEVAQFNHSGTQVVTGSDDGTARIWDANSGKELVALKGHTQTLTSASFSPDDTAVVTSAWDSTARIWNATTGQPAFALPHSAVVAGAIFTPDSARVLTWTQTGSIRLWDAANGKELANYTGPANLLPGSVALSGDASKLLACGTDGTACVFNAQTGAAIARLTGHQPGPLRGQFNADGSRIITASGDKTARIWDSATGAELRVLAGHSNAVTAAVFSPDGAHVSTSSKDGTVKLWKVQRPAVTGAFSLPGHTRPITALLVEKKSRRVISGSEDGTAKVWDIASGQELFTLDGHTGPLASVGLSADETRIMTASTGGTVHMWDAETGKSASTWTGPNQAMWSAALSPDARCVVTGMLDFTARVWDAATGSELFALRGHTNGVRAVAFSPDGSRIITVSHDKTAKVWDAATGRNLYTISAHTDSINAAVFSSDGSRIVTVSNDATARIWNAATGQELSTLRPGANFVVAAAISPDDAKLVTGASDGSGAIWDMKTGAQLRAIAGHDEEINQLAFSPDGQRIASGAVGDPYSRLWDVESGAEMASLSGPLKSNRFVVFTPDGRFIVAASGKLVLVWQGK